MSGLPSGGEQADQAHSASSMYPNALVNRASGMNFIHLSVDEGLSQGTVNVIYQDTAGFIWVGTQNGLNRYDGYQFLVFKNKADDLDSISNSAIRDILEDQQGNLWFATEGGLNKFDLASNKFVRYLHAADNADTVASNYINCLVEDGNQRLWIGTASGLDLFDPAKGTFIHYENDPNYAYSLAGNNVNALLIDSQQRVWIGTNNGLSLFNPSTGTFTNYRHDENDPLSLADDFIIAIAEDSHGSIWVGTNGGGVNELNVRLGGFQRYFYESDNDLSLSNNLVNDVFVSRDGTIWVGTVNGLNKMEINTNFFTHINYNPEDPGGRESLSNAQVTSILEDRSGAVWVGTNGGGLNVFDPALQRFVHIQHEPANTNSISNSSVTSIMVDSRNYLWIGTLYGLNRYDPRTGIYQKYYKGTENSTGLTSNTIQTLYEDSGGIIWVGTDRGLNYYDAENDHFVPYQTDIEHYRQNIIDLSGVSISAIVKDNQNYLWLGTLGWGLIKIDLNTSELFMYSHQASRVESIGSNEILCLMLDHLGQLWVGTDSGGLNKFDDTSGHFVRFSNEPGNAATLSNDTVNAILEDTLGRFWLGTDGGLNLFNPETGVIIALREKDGLASDMVSAMVEDKVGRLWISTSNGLSRYTPDTGIFKNFDVRDGLQSNEFNKGAAFKDPWGVLYFGGANGMNIFDPGQILINDFIPPIVLISIKQRGNELMTPAALVNQETIVLQWPNNYFDFDYAALSYIQQDKNQFAYKLENFDNEWNLAGSRRYGSYTNLPGGTFFLHIIGSNNDGQWNTEGAIITVKVMPPFWATIWFQGGLAVVLIGGVITGYRLRVRSIEQNSRKLANQVAERTHEIEQRRQAAEGLRDVLALLNSNRALEDSLFFIGCQIQKLIDSCQTILFSISEAKYVRSCVQCKKGLEKEQSFYDRSSYILDPSPEDSRWLVDLALEGKVYNTTNFQNELELTPGVFDCLDREARAMSFTPIMQGSEVFGGLVVLFRKAKVPARYETYLLELFADQAALAIGNSKLRAKVEDLAVMSERNRLARDLHDAVTQTLFSASLIAEALPSTWEKDKGEGRKLLGDLRQLTRGALAEMRSLLMELRPRSVTDARLPDLLHQLAEATIGRTGMEVIVNATEAFRLPQDVHMGLYRIAQEALANIIKHSRAKKAELTLQENEIPGQSSSLQKRINVILTIRDNGRGFVIEDVPMDHFGLRNMRERSQAISAQIEIVSAPKKGTSIRVEWTGEEQTDE